MKITNLSIILRSTMLLALLLGAVSAASADDRFYIDPVNIEPAETKTLSFILDNSQEFYGFQADITLPDGLEIVFAHGRPDMTLSSRVDDSYTMVSNPLSPTTVRVGAFSLTHSPISGESGPLMYLTVKADSDFAGGSLQLSDILFVGAGDKDVALPDFSLELGAVHSNSFYIPDFKIAVGETKTVSLILDNETSFTAFQTDIFLPEGLIIKEGSFILSSRASTGHTVTAKSFTDGRTRVACFSSSNTSFTGNSGALLSFDITANKDVAEECSIELRNQIFSTAKAKEVVLPNSLTLVETERAFVEAVILDKTELELFVGQSDLLSVEIQPSFASTKDVEWSSDAPEIATVSQSGTVTAIAEGSAIIKAMAVDGSGKYAECKVSVKGIPVSEIQLNSASTTLRESETLLLEAAVFPENASDKSVTWESLSPETVTVNESGLITAIRVGEADVIVKSVSNPDVSATCHVTVEPMPVANITLSSESISIEIGATFDFTAEIEPSTATDKKIVWSVSDPMIASVDETGKVTGVALGSTKVIAVAADGFGATAIATVNVVPTPATGITIETPESTEFKAGETISLSATVLPENASDKSVTWSSEKPEIATVDAEGRVTGVSVGEVKIIATNSAGISDEILLTVVPTLAESISVIPETLTLWVGGESRILVSVLPATTTDKNVTWVSSNPEVADVDEEGLVHAYSLGESVITVTTADGSNISAECKVSVEATPATDVKIDYDGPTTLHVGETALLSATVLPEDATDKSVTWTSQDSSILTVSEDGLVTAENLGEAWICATNTAGISDYISFSVIPTPVSSISLSADKIQLKTGESSTLTATVLPEDATDKSLAWHSANTNIAMVDANGMVTALSLGSTEVTATAVDGSDVSAQCIVEVIPTPVESVRVSADGNTTLKAGESVKLIAEVLPETASDKTVAWTSSDPTIVEVDSDGLVTAVGVGEAFVAASAGDYSDRILITVERTLAEAIVFNQSSIILKVGGSTALSPRISPATTTDKTLYWETSDSEIATVDGNGVVTGLAVGSCVISATTCDGSNLTAYCQLQVSETAPDEIYITPDGPFVMDVDEQLQLNATVLPETASDKSVIWEAGSDNISVGQKGLVTALAPIENSWVRAFDAAGHYAQVEITVRPVLAQSIALSQTEAQLKVGESLTLKAEVSPENTSDKKIEWSSSASNIVEVDQNGKITALGLGEADIVASAIDGSGVTATCRIVVVSTPVESVTVSSAGSTTLKAGETVQLYATVLPEDATSKEVTWSSLDSGVASVDRYGRVTAEDVGTAMIRASVGNMYDEIEIKVEPTLVARIEFNYSELNMEVGEVAQVDALISPVNATIKLVKWESRDPEVAAVDEEGRVVANAIGSTLLTATALDESGVSSSLVVNVIPTSVSAITVVYDGETVLKVGDKVQLSAKVYPENATDKSFTWEVKDSNILTVDEEGVMEAVGLGESWVGAFAAGGYPYDIVNFSVVATPVEKIEIEQEGGEMLVGQTRQLFATVYPSAATNKDIVWTSSDDTVAAIDQTGLVTARSVGTVVVTASATDGSGVKSETEITVGITPVERVAISALGNTTLKDGETVMLITDIYPVTATFQDVVWSSDVPEIADVSKTGLVTAKSKIGTARIIASVDDCVGEIEISVVETPVERLEIIQNPDLLRVGDVVTFSADVYPLTATSKSVKWSVEDPQILEFVDSDDSMVIYRTLNAGETSITAEASNGVKVTKFVNVLPVMPQEVILDKTSIRLSVDETQQLSATLLPENATDRSVSWLSDNKEVAVVDDEGVVKAIKPGQATITAISNALPELRANCVVEVVRLVSSIALNEHEIVMQPEGTFELIATVEPIDATDKSVVWSSSDDRVAEVDENGLILAREAGQAVITVSTLDGSDLSDDCEVMVKEVSGLRLVSVGDVEFGIADSILSLTGLAHGEKAWLIGMNGMLYASWVGDGNPVTFNLEKGGCYILKIGNHAFKLIAE